MKKVLLVLLVCFSMISMTFAVDFTPQGNINLRNYYNITNGWNASFSGNVSAGFFQGDGSQLTNVPPGSETDPHWTANWTNYLKLAGDTMTGNLDMGSNNILNVVNITTERINASCCVYLGTILAYDGNSIAVQPDGDTDDYFSFKTPANRPTIKREGGKFVYFDSSNVYDVGISLRDDDTYSGTLNYEKDNHMMTLLGKNSPVGIKTNSEYVNYFMFETFNHQPEISIFNGTLLIINDSLEVIGFINSTDWSNVSITEIQISDLQIYRLDSWDNFTGIPTATPSNGDTTHLSTANQIYDWVISLTYQSKTYIDSIGNWSADKASYSTTTYIDSVGNWSADKGSYSLTTAVTAQNTSQTNYIDFANSTQATWVDVLFIRFTELVTQVGNWSADKGDYYTSAEVDTINTSVTNTFGSYYTKTESNAINDSNNAYILYVNSTNTGGAYDDAWINGTIDAKILTNNGSVNNYILWVNSTNPVGEGSYDDAWINTTIDAKDVVVNTSMKNYVDWNNVSVTNAIAGGAETDPKWTANWTNVAFTNVWESFDERVNFSKDISIGSSDADHYIYFYEGTDFEGEYFKWANSPDRFEISDALYITGGVECSGILTGAGVTSSSDIKTTGAGDDLWLGTTTQADAKVQLYADGHALLADKRFNITAAGNVTSNVDFCIVGGGCLSNSGAVETDPKWTANWTNVGFTNIWETFVERVNFTENISLGVAEGDHGICFYDGGEYCGEQLFWDDSQSRFVFTNNLIVDGITFSAGVYSTNGNMYVNNGDLYTIGGSDDLWLGDSTQGDAPFQAYADGSLIIADKKFNVSTVGNATAKTDFCIVGGSCLSTVAGAGYDDGWINNTIDTKDTTVNTSMKNYADDTFLQSLVGDTSPQLGGYLDTAGQNIGSTADEIENVYVATNSKIYFGNGQEFEIYTNGTFMFFD